MVFSFISVRFHRYLSVRVKHGAFSLLIIKLLFYYLLVIFILTPFAGWLGAASTFDIHFFLMDLTCEYFPYFYTC
jgi:hypothetical protein